MKFLSKFFDFVFPLTSSLDSDSNSGSSESGIFNNFFEHESILVNPANGMPMRGGMGGVDVTGNFWGQSGTFDDHGYYSSVDHSVDSFDASSMFDSGSMFD